MEELKYLLDKVSDSYTDFVVGIIGDIRDNPEKLDELKNFIKNNPEATSSDIIKWTMDNVSDLPRCNSSDSPYVGAMIYDEETGEILGYGRIGRFPEGVARGYISLEDMEEQ